MKGGEKEMNPTPVVTTSTGPQQIPNQKQKILPKEFETQLAGYLKKEQSSKIHKEVSDSEETTDKESNEEPTDETLNLNSPLFYTGLFNSKQEQQPAEASLNESSKTEVIQLLKSSEPTFDKQVNVEAEKISAFVQNEDPVTNRQQNLIEESFVELETKEVIEPQMILKDQMVINEEAVKMEKIAVSKPTIAIEPIIKANGENVVEDVTNLLMKESSLVETELVQSPVKKETVMADTILSTGRFLTAEWKNGQIVNQSITEPDILTVNPLNESLTDSGQQPEIDVNGSKLTVLTESLSTEGVLKDSVSRLKNSESYEVLTKVNEVDTQGQPVQQQQIVEAASVKQSSVVETVKQVGIQQISEVVTQQVETLLSGKQSIAHVTLTPERMGEVNITVELKDNVLITKIVVDTMETKELLANGMHQLTDKLDRQNIRLGDLTIQLNDNASSNFTSQERQEEEKKSAFGQQKINVTANEKETQKSEEIVENNTKRLSILV
ncbi:unknown conserved protein [Carnobacterium sp. 17-4]|nr:unknown conserved protein [Carnobacterium sp. 17-4]